MYALSAFKAECALDGQLRRRLAATLGTSKASVLVPLPRVTTRETILNPPYNPLPAGDTLIMVAVLARELSKKKVSRFDVKALSLCAGHPGRSD